MATTKATAVENIVANVKELRNINGSDRKITILANRYYDSACAYTGYTVLPDALLSFVEDAVLMAWSKRGAEGLNSQSAVGVTEQYIDVETALRQNLRHKRNPMSVAGAEEEVAAQDDSEDTDGDDNA